MKTIKLPFLLICVSLWLCECFLLDKATPAAQLGGSVITDKHFMTLIELLSDEKQHREKLEQKVAALEQKTGSGNQNDKMNQMELYIQQLEHRVTKMEQSMANSENKTCTTDNDGYLVLMNRTLSVENKFTELEIKYTTLKASYDTSVQKLTQMEQKIGDINNYLKGINQLQTLQSVQREVQGLISKTAQLESNENARSQDCLALFQKAKNTEQEVQNVQTTVGVIQNELSRSNETTQHNLSFLGQRLTAVDGRHNITEQKLSSDIKKNNKKVMVRACVSSNKPYASGEVIMFNTVKFSTGLSNITTFQSTGKFACEEPGVFVIMVTIFAKDDNDYYYIMKNSEYLQLLQAVYDQNVNYHTVSSSVIVDLLAEDTIYVVPSSDVDTIKAGSSCINIIKVK